MLNKKFHTKLKTNAILGSFAQYSLSQAESSLVNLLVKNIIVSKTHHPTPDH